MKDHTLATVLFCVTTSLSAQDVELHQGCDCPTVRLDDAYCAASAVFEALALSNDTVHVHGGIDPVARDVVHSIRTSFLVSDVIKGKVYENVIVNSAKTTDDCGYNFQTGERYLVFASRENGILWTGLCDATRPLAALTPGFRDSLTYVLAGNRWEGGVPVRLPCPE